MNSRGRVYKLEQAKRDLVEIYAYLSVRGERTARRFLAECRKAFELILRMPGIGRRWESAEPALRTLRVTTVSRRFRAYLIFYRPVKAGIEIVRIVHGARDLSVLIASLPFGEDSDD